MRHGGGAQGCGERQRRHSGARGQDDAEEEVRRCRGPHQREDGRHRQDEAERCIQEAPGSEADGRGLRGGAGDWLHP